MKINIATINLIYIQNDPRFKKEKLQIKIDNIQNHNKYSH